MRHLRVIGAGGHGLVVAEAAALSGPWDRISLHDDQKPVGLQQAGFAVEGTVEALRRLLAAGERVDVVVAIGNNAVRLALTRELASLGANVATVVHPAATVSPSASLGAGTVMLAGSVVNALATLGEACIVNTRASVDHHGRIGHGCHICPAVSLAGNVHVDELAWVGIGATIIQGVTIGRAAVVGAGACVVRDVAAESTVIGCPAKPLNR